MAKWRRQRICLGFDMDGDTIWKNKIRTLPNGEKYIKGPSIGLYGVKKELTVSWKY